MSGVGERLPFNITVIITFAEDVELHAVVIQSRHYVIVIESGVAITVAAIIGTDHAFVISFVCDNDEFSLSVGIKVQRERSALRIQYGGYAVFKVAVISFYGFRDFFQLVCEGGKLDKLVIGQRIIIIWIAAVRDQSQAAFDGVIGFEVIYEGGGIGSDLIYIVIHATALVNEKDDVVLLGRSFDVVVTDIFESDGADG